MSQHEPDPWFGPETLQAFADFWAIYEAAFDDLTERMLGHTADGSPVFHDAARRDKARSESRALSDEVSRAVVTGDWRRVEATFEARGAMYADLGLSLAEWTKLALGIKVHLVPRVVAAYGSDPDRLSRAICAMESFLDRGVLVAGGTYQAARDAMVDEQRALVHRRTTELAESDTRYRSLFEHNPLPIWIYEVDTHRIRDANEAALALFGYSREEFFEKTVLDLAPTADREMVSSRVAAIPSGSRRYPTERIQRKDGTVRLVEVTSSELVSGQRSPRMIIAKDVTEERRATEALAMSEARFARLAESGIVGILLSSFDGRILEANDALLNLLGYTRADLQAGLLSWAAMTPPEYAAQSERVVKELRANGVCMPVEKEYFRKDGSRVWVLVGVAVLQKNEDATIALVLDVTERRELAEQLRHAQKMEAIGILAGGVAHDFNNLLSAILGYSDMILSALPGDSRLRSDALEIRRAGERAASLTRQLLAFSRKQMLHPEVINLNDVVAGAERLLRRLIGEDVELVTILGAGLANVKADSSQMEQVLMNLAVNARDAMPHGGKLIIETGNVEVDAAFARPWEGLTAGPYVMLAVTDSGTGMDAATSARIFEPFFTTKKERGTGLGLSTAFGIARQSGGTIVVESEVGKGTRFEVYVPQSSEMARMTRRPEIAQAKVHGGETILLVEDEAQVRKLARECLERQGYRVIEAAGPVEAISRAGDHAGPIDLLLTDVIMPQMTGYELADRLRAVRPDLGVLFMSGYSDEAAREGVDGSMLLDKPITPSIVLSRVHEALSHRAAEGARRHVAQ